MTTRTDRIRHVVFDFDGTCTQIPAISENFLRDYHAGLNATIFVDDPVSPTEWKRALEAVRNSSPLAGWTLATTPSAPAAADPYILSYEAAQVLRRRRGTQANVSSMVFREADEANPAPLRPELHGILLFFRNEGVKVTFISNSSTAKVNGRITELFGGKRPEFIAVESGASKYMITEPAVDDAGLSAEFLSLFRELPASAPCARLERPIYLRRAYYARAIERALGGDAGALPATLFCGDIWEMDLAMPIHLGANAHLIERAAPYETYAFEREAVVEGKKRARASTDLNGLRDWF